MSIRARAKISTAPTIKRAGITPALRGRFAAGGIGGAGALSSGGLTSGALISGTLGTCTGAAAAGSDSALGRASLGRGPAVEASRSAPDRTTRVNSLGPVDAPGTEGEGKGDKTSGRRFSR